MNCGHGHLDLGLFGLCCISFDRFTTTFLGIHLGSSGEVLKGALGVSLHRLATLMPVGRADFTELIL